MLKTLQKLLRLPSEKRRLLPRAVAHLLASRVIHATRHTKAILDDLQHPTEPIGRTAQTALDPHAAAWAIETAARYVPWRSDCLLQVMAASRWLRRHGCKPQFKLGLARTPAGDLAAHAWLTLDDRVLVGGNAAFVSDFVPILSTAPSKDRPQTESSP